MDALGEYDCTEEINQYWVYSEWILMRVEMSLEKTTIMKITLYFFD